MPALTVHNAEIKTAVVEVKALTIDGKQVTLAVFRQLQSARWLDADCNPRGQGWGRVNYCPDGRRCGGFSRGNEAAVPHIHIVWQFGAELRHDVAYKHSYYDPSKSDEWHQAFWDAALHLPQLFIAV